MFPHPVPIICPWLSLLSPLCVPLFPLPPCHIVFVSLVCSLLLSVYPCVCVCGFWLNSVPWYMDFLPPSCWLCLPFRTACTCVWTCGLSVRTFWTQPCLQWVLWISLCSDQSYSNCLQPVSLLADCEVVKPVKPQPVIFTPYLCCRVGNSHTLPVCTVILL